MSVTTSTTDCMPVFFDPESLRQHRGSSTLTSCFKVTKSHVARVDKKISPAKKQGATPLAEVATDADTPDLLGELGYFGEVADSLYDSVAQDPALLLSARSPGSN